MPSISRPLSPLEHLDQAIHNEEFARGILSIKSANCDWVFTACFYSALHFLYYKYAPPTVFSSHVNFESFIMGRVTSDIWSTYKKIKDKSISARYYPHLAKYMRNDRKYSQYAISELEALKI